RRLPAPGGRRDPRRHVRPPRLPHPVRRHGPGRAPPGHARVHRPRTGRGRRRLHPPRRARPAVPGPGRQSLLRLPLPRPEQPDRRPAGPDGPGQGGPVLLRVRLLLGVPQRHPRRHRAADRRRPRYRAAPRRPPPAGLRHVPGTAAGEPGLPPAAAQAHRRPAARLADGLHRPSTAAGPAEHRPLPPPLRTDLRGHHMDRTDNTRTAPSTATATGPATGTRPATGTGPAEGAVLAAIRRHAVAILPDLRPADIVPERTLAELGLNSVDRSEVVTNVMDDLDVYVPITEFRQAMPVGDLVGLFERHR